MSLRSRSKFALASVCVALILSPKSDAGDLPKPTKEGVESLIKLIDRCVAGGGLRAVKVAGQNDAYYEVADEGKLAEVVRSERSSIARPLVDALAGGWEAYDEREEPFAIALLKTIGSETRDERAMGFGEIFAGQVAARTQETRATVGLFDQAARHFAEAGERGWQATALTEAGLTERRLGNLGNAIDHYRRALAIRQEILRADDPLVATTLNNLGTAYDESGNFPEAEKHMRQALAIREKVLAGDDPALASSYRNLSLLDYRTGRLVEAGDLASKSLAIRRIHADKSPKDLADSLNALGVIRSEKGELREADVLLDEALEIQQRLGPRAELDRAVTLSNKGVVAERAGDFSKAIDLFGQMLAIRKRRLPPRHPEIAHGLALLSKASNDVGDHVRAIELGEEALAIRRQFYGLKHPDVARSLNNLGGIHHDRGDDPAALAYYRQALTIWKTTYSRPHPDIGFCLDNIAGILRSRGDLAGALAGYLESLPILEATLGPRHQEVSACLLGIGATHEAAGQPDRAMVNYRKAVEIARAAGPGGKARLVPALNRLAGAEVRQGNLAGAERDLMESLEIAGDVLGAGHPGLIRTMAEASSIRRMAGDLAGATRIIDMAIDVLRGGRGAALPDNELALDLLSRRARLLEVGLGERPTVPQLLACAEAFEDAASLLERLRGGVVNSREGKLTVAEGSAELFPLLVGIRARLATTGDQTAHLCAAFAAAERGMARVFLESLGRSRADRLGGVDPALIRQTNILVDQRSLIDRRLEDERGRTVESRRPEVIGLLDERRVKLLEESDRLARRIDAEYPRFAALKSPRPCTVEEAREVLLDDEVALIFLPGIDGSFLLTLSKAGDVEKGGLAIHRLPPTETIAEMVASMSTSKTLEDVDASRERGAEAYQMLLESVTTTIRGKSLVIVAGGPLGSLPFEMLVEPGSGQNAGRFLVEGHRIRYAPSLTSLRMVGLRDKSRTRPNLPLWAMGDPIYRRTDPRLEPGDRVGDEPATGLNFDRLPATGAEVALLSNLMGAQPEDILLGREATEASVKQFSTSGALANARHVHFATHGVLKAGERGQPSLVLSLVGDQKGEDGYLTLDEVTGLGLDADLVVLSACQTGLGDTYQSEGVDGLARALRFYHRFSGQFWRNFGGSS